MGRLRNALGVLKLLGGMALFLSVPSGTAAQTIPASDVSAYSVPVYVDDFELSAMANAAPPARSQTSSTPGKKLDAATTQVGASTMKSAAVFLDTDAPNVQARRLTDFFSATLVELLRKNSYPARRQQGSRPESGAMIRGVFADVDPMNHVRKAILGSASTSTKFTLYVGVFNLARADQPLYQLAVVQSPDYRFGPVITLNNYIPMAKYELNKNPAEDDIRRICGQIVGNLTELLRINPTAFWR